MGIAPGCESIRQLRIFHKMFYPLLDPLLYQLLGAARDAAGEVDGVDAFENDVVSLHGVGASKRGSARQELEHQNSQGPVVSTDVVAFVQYHLFERA